MWEWVGVGVDCAEIRPSAYSRAHGLFKFWPRKVRVYFGPSMPAFLLIGLQTFRPGFFSGLAPRATLRGNNERPDPSKGVGP